MKLNDALARGFVIFFSIRRGGVLIGDNFPDVQGGEDGIPSKEEAHRLAVQFAKAKHVDPVVNVRILTADSFNPVPGYTQVLNRYEG